MKCKNMNVLKKKGLDIHTLMLIVLTLMIIERFFFNLNATQDIVMKLCNHLMTDKIAGWSRSRVYCAYTEVFQNIDNSSVSPMHHSDEHWIPGSIRIIRFEVLLEK